MINADQLGEPEPPRLIQIANVFARYGNFTLGGGSATVAVMHREILEKRRWITPDQFTLSFALARLTPGTNLLAFGAGVGWMVTHPILVNRPIVTTPLGTKLSRPSEVVLDLLERKPESFIKEDGQVVIPESRK